MPKGLLWQAAVAIIFRNFFEAANTEALTLNLVVQLYGTAVAVVSVVVVAANMQSASVVAGSVHRLAFFVFIFLFSTSFRRRCTLSTLVACRFRRLCVVATTTTPTYKGLFPFNSRVIICY